MWERYNSLSQDEKQAKVDEEYKWVNDYFSNCIDFVEKYYGAVISAEIHFHETTPHLHVNTIGDYPQKTLWGTKENLVKCKLVFMKK